MDGFNIGVGLVGVCNAFGVSIYGFVTGRAAVGIGFLTLTVTWIAVYLLAARAKARRVGA